MEEGSNNSTKTTRKGVKRSARLRSEHVFASLVDIESGADQAFAIVQNVSATGIGILTPQPPEPGKEIRMRTAIGEAMFDLVMEVARVDASNEGHQAIVGLRFAKDCPDRKQFLRHFLDRRKDQD